MKLLTRQNLDKWVTAQVAEQVRVVAPVIQAGQPVMAPVQGPAGIDLSPVIARNSFNPDNS